MLVQLFPNELTATSLPRSAAFVPLVQQAASVLGGAGDTDQPDVMRVGESRRVRLAELRGLKGAVQANGPAEKEFQLSGSDGNEILATELIQAGNYSLEHPLKKTARKRWLAVNPVLGESELAPLTAEVQQQVFGESGVVRMPFADVAGAFTHRQEIAIPLLLLLFAAFVAEALLGAWQSRRGARRKAAERNAVALSAVVRSLAAEAIAT